MSTLGLPGLRNLVNVYTSSTNRNDPVYKVLQDFIFFILQISKIADIFLKKFHEKCTLCEYSKLVSRVS